MPAKPSFSAGYRGFCGGLRTNHAGRAAEFATVFLKCDFASLQDSKHDSMTACWLSCQQAGKQDGQQDVWQA
jgi:hypothetical protein